MIVEGRDLTDKNTDINQVRQKIGMVFQEPEHQFVASSVRDEAAVGPKSMGKSEEESYAIADNMIERMNLARFAQATPFTLSGGEKRRLSVASMLAAAPKVLVMDEPTFGQDFTTWTEMVKLIAGARDAGCSVIMVTHEPELASCADRIITILDGKVQSDVVQDSATRERNREALFASLEGNMRIGGDSASGEVHQKTAAELASYAAPAAAAQQPEQPKP